MRLWHYKLIPFLPKSQLLAQWRELNCILKGNNPKHILINYVYEYPDEDLMSYSSIVIKEMRKRGFKLDTYNYERHFGRNISDEDWFKYKFNPNPFKKHHTFRYFQQCFYNLQEKYDRGQKDFSKDEYDKLFCFFIEQNFIKGGYMEE